MRWLWWRCRCCPFKSSLPSFVGRVCFGQRLFKTSSLHSDCQIDCHLLVSSSNCKVFCPKVNKVFSINRCQTTIIAKMSLFQSKFTIHWLPFAFWLAFCFTVCLAQQNPTISYVNPDKVVNIGDTVDLQCSVQYTYGFPVIWAKIDPNNPSNNLFISRKSSLSIPDNR